MSEKDNPDKQLQAHIDEAVAKKIAEYHNQMAQLMQQSMQFSIQKLDETNAALEMQRKQLDAERDEVRAALNIIENEAEQITQTYFEDKRKSFIEFIKTDLLRELATRHLKAGKSVKQIMEWLGVEEVFVSDLRKILNENTKIMNRTRVGEVIKLPHNPRLRYVSQGSGGTIWYEDDRRKFSIWYEFGSRDAIAIIELPTPAIWETRTSIPLEERDLIIRYIAEQVIKDQLSHGGVYKVEESSLTIYHG